MRGMIGNENSLSEPYINCDKFFFTFVRNCFNVCLSDHEYHGVGFW